MRYCDPKNPREPFLDTVPGAAILISARSWVEDVPTTPGRTSIRWVLQRSWELVPRLNPASTIGFYWITRW